MPRPEKWGGGRKNMRILEKQDFYTLYGENPGTPGSKPGNRLKTRESRATLLQNPTFLIRLLIWIISKTPVS